MKYLIALTFICAAPGVAFAEDRVQGLLSLPEVFGSASCEAFTAEDIPLHAAPNDGKSIATIRVDRPWSLTSHGGGCEGLQVRVHEGDRRHELPTLEYDYEMPAAIVLEHREGWYKIRVGDHPAWLKASPVDRFMPLADLYDEFVGVTTISKKFTGRLVNAPGAINGPILPRVSPQQSVRVAEIREAGGRQWVKVEVLSNSACTAGADGPPEVIAIGWLPLHDNDGEPTVWFSSRGC